MQPINLDHKRYCHNGFTLIEVLIAMAIFSIGFLAIGGMQISAFNSNLKSRNQTTVLTYAKDKVEDLKALEYTHTDLSAGEHSVGAGGLTMDTDGIDNDEDGQVDESGENGTVSIKWQVTEIDLTGDGENDAKAVRVTVIRDVGGKQRQSVLDFIKAQR